MILVLRSNLSSTILCSPSVNRTGATVELVKLQKERTECDYEGSETDKLAVGAREQAPGPSTSV